MTLEEIQNEVLRKIGRNVLNFQRLEAMLKASIAHSSVQSHPRDLKNALQKKERAVSMKTMGNLVGDYVRSVYEPGNQEHASANNEGTLWLSYSFKIEADEEHVVERTASLARLVEERNKLIHQMLAAYDASTIIGCENMVKTLDEQHEMLVSEYEQVRETYNSMIDLRKEAFSQILKGLPLEPE